MPIPVALGGRVCLPADERGSVLPDGQPRIVQKKLANHTRDFWVDTKR